MLRRALLPALILSASPALAAPEGDPLADLMGPELYERTGMDKLDADEREALVRWLQGRDAGRRVAERSAPPVSPSPAAAPPEPGRAPEPEALDEESAGREGPGWLSWLGGDEEAAEEAVEEPAGVQEETAGRDGGLFAFMRGGDDAENSFRARIDGPFEGWRGDTVFRLDNGQVWQQRRSDVFVTELDSPEVILKRNRLGFYSMEVPAVDETVLVKRIR
jgi:hypothetical protein